MKRLISITVVLAMICTVLSLGAFTVSAAESGTWGDLSWVLDDEGTLTISGEGEMNVLDPWDGEGWHCSSDYIKSVVIENGVTTIGDYAFHSCSALESVTIPDSVTAIGGYAFEFCTALESVTIPDSVTIIGDFAFSQCEALESVTIPDGVTTIGHSAFSGCTALDSVTIPDSVTTIGDFAFEFCAALENVTIPGSVTSIGGLAFGNCTSLKSIDVADGNTEYLDVDGVLFNKDKTTLVQYPAGRTNASYAVPDSVTEIGDCAFESCTALKSIIIGRSVTLIGDYAFNFCTALETVYYCGSEDRWGYIVIIKGNDPLLNANIVYNYVPPKAELGDVNGDGYTDNLDAAVILKYDAGLTEEISEAADVNGDDCTDNLDAVRILKYDAGIIDEL